MVGRRDKLPQLKGDQDMVYFEVEFEKKFLSLAEGKESLL